MNGERTAMDAAGGEAVRTVLAVNFNHDGAAVLLIEGRIAGLVTTERLSRRKKHPGLREPDLDELLAQAGIGLADIDHVLLCNLHNMDSPDVSRLHGSDLKETWFEFWVNQRADRVSVRGVEIACTVNPDHHTLHAASAFLTSPFDAAVTVAIDPLGCRAFAGRDNRLYPLRRDYDRWFNANIGYCHVAEELFGSSIVGAGKVMGLAPYGRPDEPPGVDALAVAGYADLVELAAKNPVMVEVDGTPLNATLAFLVQLGLEQQLLAVLDDLAPLCLRNGIPLHLCLTGGTALNAVANEVAFARSRFERLHLHPACGDDGTAIGAALWFWHDVLGHPRTAWSDADLMYSVRRYSEQEVDAALARHAGELEVECAGDYVCRTAELIANGRVVGWFDGAGEIGPRALGHRSMLADPRDPTMRDRLNSTVKFREHFRPFAPSVLDEHAAEWFGLRGSPFMLRTCQVLRPGVPAITHVDGSSRIQTVTRQANPAFHELIGDFHRRTGVPMVLNTSLNIRGQPIVEAPSDALDALLGSALDRVVFPGRIVRRRGAS